MKCLKVEEYLKRTSCLKETRLLHEDLETYVMSGPGPQGRTLCDRVIKACNQQLGVGPLDTDHTTGLVKLVELALHGYDTSELGAQGSPLYIEKIFFHVFKKLATLAVHRPCSHLGSLLYNRLAPAPQTEDYGVLVRSCFGVLWKTLPGARGEAPLGPRDKLRCQLQALSFLLLLDTEGGGAPTPVCSEAALYAENALAEFEKGCGTLTEEDASCLLREALRHLLASWPGERAAAAERSHRGGPVSLHYLSWC